MKKSNYIELGATLFVPGVHKNLLEIAEGKKYKSLKSVVIDCEDGIDSKQVDIALQNLKELLINFTHSPCLLFIRPRDVTMLELILTFDSIDKIDGFILPKFSLSNAYHYLKITGTNYSIMPSIEGEELFNQTKLLELRDILLHYKEQIITIRFGLEDMLRQLSMRRGCEESLFDIGVTSSVMGQFIAIFKGAGFNISAGVYPCFKDSQGLKKDVLRDLKEGLFTKTIIHPNQIDIVQELYKVSWKEFNEACEIYGNTDAVFNQNDKMAERTTMTPHSLEIIKRAEVYGIKDN